MLKILIACANNQIMGVSNKSSLKQPPLFAKFLLRLCLAILGPALIDMPGAEEKHPIAAHGNHELHPALECPFAAEPAVVDPVAMAFDEDGRVYVVEMRDYPSGIGPTAVVEERFACSKMRMATARLTKPPCSPKGWASRPPWRRGMAASW